MMKRKVGIRLLSLLMTLVMALSLLPSAVFAEEQTEDQTGAVTQETEPDTQEAGTVDGETEQEVDSDTTEETGGFQEETSAETEIPVMTQSSAADQSLTDDPDAVVEDTITVTFSLLGDSEHGDDGQVHCLSLGNLTEWIPATEYEVAADATALDVFELALTEAGFTWDNAGGNYITAVNDLAAYDNGPNSGWMFTYNGSYGMYGIAEQTLQDGDVIMFHYTDDWSLEDYGTGGGETETPESPADAAVEQIYQETGAWLVSATPNPTVADTGGDWVVLGLARAGYGVPEGYFETYFQNVASILLENDGVLSTRKYTEYSRVILALTAAGYDVTDVAGYNLLDSLADYEKVVWQGINGPIFALLALDSAGYDIPAAEGSSQTTRQNLIDYILGKELAGGGWALTGDQADPDVTAMAIQALAAYYDTDAQVKAAVDRALDVLSALQDDQGGFASQGTANCESCAQVVVALTALGIDPDTDARFVKTGGSVLDALCSYSVSGGGFSHIAGGERNGMATEQGYYALAAYFRFQERKTSLYDMSDVTLLKGEADLTAAKTPDQSGSDGQNSGSTQTGIVQTGDAEGGALVLAGMLLAAGGLILLTRPRKQTRA